MKRAYNGFADATASDGFSVGFVIMCSFYGVEAKESDLESGTHALASFRPGPDLHGRGRLDDHDGAGGSGASRPRIDNTGEGGRRTGPPGGGRRGQACVPGQCEQEGNRLLRAQDAARGVAGIEG